MGSDGKVTSFEIRQRKVSRGGARLVAITAYDYAMASLVDSCDIVLVGDSLGMVIQGGDDTLSVTVDQAVYHTRCVARAVRRAHLVADMPFLSYQINTEDALRNAGRLLAEGGAAAVKLEGGRRSADTIRKLVDTGIPVMGHVGLTPQSVHQFGGFKQQGKSEETRRAILDDALSVEQAGVYCIVLESIPSTLAQEITERVKIPTIGIGAGPYCDGQILVINDMLGLGMKFKPRFVKRYLSLSEEIEAAVGKYAAEVRDGIFPGEEHSF